MPLASRSSPDSYTDFSLRSSIKRARQQIAPVLGSLPMTAASPRRWCRRSAIATADANPNRSSSVLNCRPHLAATSAERVVVSIPGCCGRIFKQPALPSHVEIAGAAVVEWLSWMASSADRGASRCSRWRRVRTSQSQAAQQAARARMRDRCVFSAAFEVVEEAWPSFTFAPSPRPAVLGVHFHGPRVFISTLVRCVFPCDYVRCFSSVMTAQPHR